MQYYCEDISDDESDHTFDQPTQGFRVPCVFLCCMLLLQGQTADHMLSRLEVLVSVATRMLWSRDEGTVSRKETWTPIDVFEKEQTRLLTQKINSRSSVLQGDLWERPVQRLK